MIRLLRLPEWLALAGIWMLYASVDWMAESICPALFVCV
jgi:hypothetical protein